MNEELLEQEGGGAADEGAPPAETVSREEYDSLRQEVVKGAAREERLLALLEGRQAPPAPPAPERAPAEIVITDEDEGDARTMKLIQKAITPLVGRVEEFQRVGLGTLGRVSMRTALASLSPERRRIYDRYKKDVDAYLSQTNEVVRAQPESLEWALKLVIADHFDELNKEAIESTQRADIKGAKPGTPSGRVGGSGANTIATPAELGFSSDQVRAIEERGGPDAWARRMSGGRYKDWGDYVKAHNKMRGVEVEGGKK